MLHLYDRATMAHALTLDLDPHLHRLLADRIGALTEDLVDFTEYLVVERGDTEEEIFRHIGFSPLIDPIDGWRFGTAGFQPGFDWVSDHGEWFEMIVTFGSSFAYVLLISARISGDLFSLCHFYSSGNQ